MGVLRHVAFENQDRVVDVASAEQLISESVEREFVDFILVRATLLELREFCERDVSASRFRDKRKNAKRRRLGRVRFPGVLLGNARNEEIGEIDAVVRISHYHRTMTRIGEHD